MQQQSVVRVVALGVRGQRQMPPTMRYPVRQMDIDHFRKVE